LLRSARALSFALIPALLPWLPVDVANAAPPPKASANADRLHHARALMRRCRPIDLHSDALLQLRRNALLDGCKGSKGLATSARHLDMVGHDAQVLALYAGRREKPIEAARAALRAYDRLVSTCPKLVGAKASELRRPALPGKTRMVLAIEGANLLGEDANALRKLARRGLFSIGPVWNDSNAWADGNAGPRRHGGLSKRGRALVDLAGELRILLDISHASDATARQILARSKLPVLATHSGARAVRNHRRNLTDDLIRGVARSGGVVGINFHCTFVVKNGQRCDAAAVARHVVHLRKVGGDGVLALGSDFDGEITAPSNLKHPGQLPNLLVALKAAGLDDKAVCGLLGDNVRRVIRRVHVAAGASPRPHALSRPNEAVAPAQQTSPRPHAGPRRTRSP